MVDCVTITHQTVEIRNL